MKSSIVGVRVIAMLSRVLEDTLRMHLEELEVHLDVAHSTTMLSHMTQGNPIYEVAIVPANPPSGEWLQICHVLGALKPSPSILVSLRDDTFSAWTKVLDAGGFGLLLEPYTSEGLLVAIQGAVKHFRGRDA